MATLFSARRKPKRIVRDDPELQQEEADEGMFTPRRNPQLQPAGSDICVPVFSSDEATDRNPVDSGPVVRRPTTNAPKSKSRLRVSFNPGEEDGSSTSTARMGTREDGEESELTTRNSRLGPSSAAQTLVNRSSGRDNRDDEGQDHDRPTYNRAYLDELRNSTPSTPRDLSSRDSPSLDLISPASQAAALDLESKFGKAAISGAASSSRIPTATEIREKKERRARLALEQAANAGTGGHGADSTADFISLEDYDSDGEFKPQRMQVGSYIPPARETESRLVPDDEDMAEGFDEFVEDSGRVTLSRKGRRQQTVKEREAMRALIDDAEGDSHSSSGGGSDSDSERERHRQYESAQTHHGMDGLAQHAAHTRQANRPRQPRATTAIPKLSIGLTRLRDMVSHLEFERARLDKRRADMARERVDVRASQAHIQTSLEEAGGELERVISIQLQRDDLNGNGNGSSSAVAGAGGDVDAGAASAQSQPPPPPPPASTGTERGLESFGNAAS